MPKVLPVVDKDGATTGWMIFCPACNRGHLFNTTPGKGPVWTFVNNDVEKPTFVASMLVKSGHYASAHKPDDECWCTFKNRYGTCEFTCSVCHSHVRDGKIQFLGDCTHALKGTTVELPDWEAQEK